MTGSPQIKNNKYYAVLNLKNQNGDRKAKWIGTGLEVRGNKRKANEILQKLLAQYAEQENAPEGGNILFADFLQSWLDNKKDKIELSTWEGYKMYTANHIIPYFRNLGLTLNQLAPKHFIDYYECKFRSGRLDGKEGGLSIRSIKSHSLIIKEALNIAVIMEYLPHNPVLNVLLPKQEARQNIGKFLDVGQANTIIKAFWRRICKIGLYLCLAQWGAVFS